MGIAALRRHEIRSLPHGAAACRKYPALLLPQHLLLPPQHLLLLLLLRLLPLPQSLLLMRILPLPQRH